MPELKRGEQVQGWLKQLHAQGLRDTEPRRVIVEAVLDWERVFSPDEFLEQLQTEHPTIGRATVYRTLKKLEEIGLLQRVQQPHDCQFYRACPEGPQHLLTCQQCGKSQPCSDEMVRALTEMFKRYSDFLLPPQPLQFFGLCSHCQHKNPEFSPIGAA